MLPYWKKAAPENFYFLPINAPYSGLHDFWRAGTDRESQRRVQHVFHRTCVYPGCSCLSRMLLFKKLFENNLLTKK